MPTQTLVVIGPTASGKTTLAVELARRLGSAEVVNADSMLVYRGMDIGTAKPTAAERGGVVHHLIDIMDVTETASVAEFQQLARNAIGDCHDRGVTPIVVGGSALYIRAIVDNFEFPGTDAQVRAKWEAELAARGPQSLFEELVNRAPQAAGHILPGNGRRIVRALEIVELTGAWQPNLPGTDYALPGVRQIGLAVQRDLLDIRIERRVEQMWAAGFVDEVRALIGKGLREGLTASRALGYRQVLAYLDQECSHDDARQQTIVRTRQFARKQLGWFRRDQRIEWIAVDDGADPGDLADQVLWQTTDHDCATHTVGRQGTRNRE